MFHRCDRATLLHGDVLDCLRGLPDESVHCVVTSPPYWGLRDYGVPGQLGLEPTPEEYVTRMVEVFREVRRVLRGDGTCWVNMGDSYSNEGKWGGASGNKNSHSAAGGCSRTKRGFGLKKKDLCGMPWRVAFALQADGWYLRSDIIWSKPNCMPSSVTDRPNTAHEYVFLLTKRARYFYDAEAVKESASSNTHSRGDGLNPKAKWKTPDGWDTSAGDGGHGSVHRNGREAGRARQNESFSAAENGVVSTRNLRSVWTIPSQPFSEAHFATFPEKLVQPCILAGTSAKGACPECGAPWVRVVEKTARVAESHRGSRFDMGKTAGRTGAARTQPGERFVSIQTGWTPACKCNCPDTIPCVVLDPFSGAGTTGLVALKLGRHYIGIELNSEYLEMSKRRLAPVLGQPALLEVAG